MTAGMLCLRLALTAAFAASATAFVPSMPLGPDQATRTRGRCVMAAEKQSRRDALQSAGAALGAIGLAGFARPVLAKSLVLTEIQIRESVDELRQTVDAFTLGKDLVEKKDYLGIKRSLRVPPVSDVRRNLRRYIAALEGKDKDESTKLYDNFIAKLEEVDRLATVGVQSDNKLGEKDSEKLAKAYDEFEGYFSKLLGRVESSRFATPINVRVETEPQ